MYVECQVRQINKYGEELCGDGVEIIRNAESTLIVLSDGLGSGVKANILSTLTKKIAATLLSEGMELEDVVDTLTKTLPVCKVRNLAYSTFTIVQISKDGKLKLVEFDSPSTFYINKKRLVYLDRESREINGKKIQISEITITEDDYVVITSDGLVMAGLETLKTNDWGWGWQNVGDFIVDVINEGSKPAILADSLITVAKELDKKHVRDDISVVVIKPRTEKLLSVAIGPPEEESSDLSLVNDFMKSSGRKIICGGSTSKLFSRILNKELIVKLDNLDNGIPPKAEMEGVNLVTEGIITLTKVLEYFDRFIECNNKMVYIRQSAVEAFNEKEKNENTSLITNNIRQLKEYLPSNPAEEIILEFKLADKIVFFVGRATNSAHQNPNFPIQVRLKPKLVGEIAERLRKIGKEVIVTFY